MIYEKSKFKMKIINCCVNLLILSVLTVNCASIESAFEFGSSCGKFKLPISDINWNEIPEMEPYSEYEEERYMTAINFVNSEANVVPREMFTRFPNLHSVDMSNVGLIWLEVGSFDSATWLNKFNGSHNQITEIPAFLFRSSLLTEVDFSYNQIDRIDPDAFTAIHTTNGIDKFLVQSQMKVLNLSHNNISEVPVRMIHKLIALETLQLSHNQIEEIPSFSFYKSDSLNELDFSFNKIQVISDFAFLGDFQLKTLNLAHNKLGKLDKQIGDNVYLEKLDVSSNQIAEMESNVFKTMQMLKFLDLSKNPIRKINNKILASLVNLKHLNLSQTQLADIQPGTFSPFEYLEILDLSRNYIKTFDVNVTPGLVSLPRTTILLKDNPIEEVNGFTKPYFTHNIQTSKILSCKRPMDKLCSIILAPLNCRVKETEQMKLSTTPETISLHETNTTIDVSTSSSNADENIERLGLTTVEKEKTKATNDVIIPTEDDERNRNTQNNENEIRNWNENSIVVEFSNAIDSNEIGQNV